MKIPTRPAPSIPRGEPSREHFYQSNKPVGQVKPKKKPPPRPPPPKFNNRKQDFTTSLTDLSAPLEDYLQAANTSRDLLKPLNNYDLFKIEPSTNSELFNSIPSSNNDDLKQIPNSSDDYFKSKSTNNDDFFKRKPLPFGNNTYVHGNSSFFGSSNVNHLDLATGVLSSEITAPKTNIVAPTIIRAQPKTKRDLYGFQINHVNRSDIDANNYSPPMPTIPPPSPPKYVFGNQSTFDDSLPHGIALYNYTATHKDDLPLQVQDVVILLRQINDEWLYGRVGDKEGMFPANFIDTRVPLSDVNDNFVTALYEFNPETFEDLKLVPGQKVKVLKKISQNWLYGESNGNYGQFPANFVDNVPPGHL